jgi:DNA-binding MarR family transcriptional regulator
MPIKLITNNLKFDTWIICHQSLNALVRFEEKFFVAKRLSFIQFTVLMAIKDHAAPPSEVDLANWLDREPNTITMILGRMAKIGLIEIARLTDRRAKHITITPKGEIEYQIGQELISNIISEVLSDFSDDEIPIMIKTLEKIREKTLLIRGLKNKGNL